MNRELTQEERAAHVAAIVRAELKAEAAARRGAWGAQDQLDARVSAAHNRLAVAEEHGTARPPVIAVYKVEDHGPCDNGPSAYCPHCGAAGRYIHHAILADGSRVAAMSGCIKLFPADPRYAALSKLVDEAHKRAQEAREKRTRLAGWWDGMIGATDAFAAGEIPVERWAAAIRAEESQRQSWLSRNGYSKFSRRR